MTINTQTSTLNRIWEVGYPVVYDTVTQYAPYQDLMTKIIELLDIRRNSSLLDLGCGTGDLLQRCSGFTNHIHGVDYSNSMLKKASARFGGRGILTKHDLSKRLPFDDASFDRVVSNNVLSYLEDDKSFIDECIRVLKPGGIMVISTLKKSFEPMKIYKDHVLSVGLFNAVKTVIPSMIVGHYNKIITKRLSDGTYRGYDQERFQELLKNSPINNLEFYDSYSDQNLLVKGYKQSW